MSEDSSKQILDDAISDEYAVRILVRDLLLNPELSYWEKVVPELEELVARNPLNSELLFPLMMLTVQRPSEPDFQKLTLQLFQHYELLHLDLFYQDERKYTDFMFSLLIGSAHRDRDGSRSQISTIADFLDNYTLEDLMVKFPATYKEAEIMVSLRMQGDEEPVE